MDNVKFRYFYGMEAEMFHFYKIPKVLFTEPEFEMLSYESIFLYGMLLDRISLSRTNGWFDDQNRVYVIFTIEEIEKKFHCANKKAGMLLANLEKCGLVEKKKRGRGLADILYVKNFILEKDLSKERHVDESNDMSRDVIEDTSYEDDLVITNSVDNSGEPHEMGTCGEFEPDEEVRDVAENTSRSVMGDISGDVTEDISRGVEKDSQVINNLIYKLNCNDIKSTPIYFTDNMYYRVYLTRAKRGEYADMIDSMSPIMILRTGLREQFHVDTIPENDSETQEYVDSIIETMIELILNQSDTVTISGNQYPAELIKSRILTMTMNDMKYMADCLAKNTTEVKNLKSYLRTTIFNAATTRASYENMEFNYKSDGRYATGSSW